MSLATMGQFCTRCMPWPVLAKWYVALSASRSWSAAHHRWNMRSVI